MSVDERMPFLVQSPHATQSKRPRLHVVLSRPIYHCGDYVVGTIHLQQLDNLNSIHDLIQSLHVYVAGRCRVDPRWHDSVTINHLYGTHPCLAEVPIISTAHSASDRSDENPTSKFKSSPSIEDVAVDLYFESSRSSSIPTTLSNHCVCFWSTNVVSLFENAKHRCTPTLEQILDWKNPPFPLILEESDWYKRGTVYIELMKSQKDVPLQNIISLNDYMTSLDEHLFEQSSTSIPSQDAARTVEQEVQTRLDYTFYAQIPIDSPPSTNNTCSRYFYSVVVYAKTRDGEVSTQNGELVYYVPLLLCWFL